MTQKTKVVTWPYAMKTVAIGGMAALFTIPIDYQPNLSLPSTGSELALQIFPPLFIYQPSNLYMHINYTFNSGLATADQQLVGIYVRDTPSAYIRSSGSSVENYMPLNLQADVNRNININIDLTSLLTGKPNNIVFLHFTRNCGASIRGPLSIAGDTINLWKLDLIYQTKGIRNEK